MNAPAPWIPASPDELLDTAGRLDRFWAEAEAKGYAKPTLDEELKGIERYYGAECDED